MCKVSIDGETFNTIKDAADFLEIPSWKLTEILLDKKEVNVNGFNVKKLGKDRIFTKLMCIETQEVFNTMKDLAEYLGIQPVELSKAFAEKDCYIKDGKRYYRLSEKSEIRKSRPKGLKSKKCPEVILDDFEDAQTTDKFLNVNIETEEPMSEQLNELIEVAKKETAEQVIQNLVIKFINNKDYETADTLLKVLAKYGDKLNIA